MSWKEIVLSELVEFSPKISLEKGELYDHIPMEAIDSGTKYPREIYQKEYTGGGTKFANGDTLFARITPCLENGKIAKVKDLEKQVGFGSTEYFVLRSKENISDSDFVYYLAKTDLVRQTAIKSMSGADGRQRADKGAVEQLKVFNIPLPTQRKIASILSAYDDLIENNLKRIKLLEEKLIIEYSLLEDESKNLKEFDFSNFVTFIKGIEPGSSNYLSEKTDGTFPFIRVGDLSKRDSDIYVEESKSKGIICNPNDVLISMDGTIGIVRYGINGCYSSGIRKAISNGILNNAFIFCYLSSKRIQGVIYSHSKGSTIQHAGSSINHFKIRLPKESSLNDFNRFSKPIYDLMNNLLNQNSKLREARDILLPKLMNGQIEI